MNIIEKDSLSARVETALESIRPFLHADGGDVELLGIEEDMTVKLKLHGNCRDCQMSIMTMKAGIEEAIRRAVPEVKAVEAVK